MTERSEDIEDARLWVALPDGGGPMTERSEGIKDAPLWVTLPDEGGPSDQAQPWAEGAARREVP
jgi:hypothetical protein